MSFRIHEGRRSCQSAEQLSASYKGPYSNNLVKIYSNYGRTIPIFGNYTYKSKFL